MQRDNYLKGAPRFLRGRWKQRRCRPGGVWGPWAAGALAAMALVLGTRAVRAQAPALGTITTVAGGFTGDGGPATKAALFQPEGAAVDPKGDLFIADTDNNRVREVRPDGTITTVAGNGTSGFSGDGGAATQAALSQPVGVAVDAKGDLFIADTFNNRVREVTPDGTITSVAGKLNRPKGVAVDVKGDLFIADTDNCRVREVRPDGTITTVAALGNRAVAVDAKGDLFIADRGNHRVREVTPGGIITTVAGGGDLGDGVPATMAELREPVAVAVDTQGDLFIADRGYQRVRKVRPDGIITTVAGGGSPVFPDLGDGGPATQSWLGYPSGLAVDAQGDLFITDAWQNRVREVRPDGTITTVAGSGTVPDDLGVGGVFSGDGGPASQAALGFPVGVAADAQGDLFIADGGNGRVREVRPDGTITTVAGGGNPPDGIGDGGPATQAALYPGGVAVDPKGDLFIADRYSGRVREVRPDGTITTVAGGGSPVFPDLGDGGPATKAVLGPESVAVDAKGDLFIADGRNHRVREVTPDGIITTAAGSGTERNSFGNVIGGFSGDGGPATQAELNCAEGVAVDAKGDLFIADTGNNRVREVRPDGIITTVAGNGFRDPQGNGGYSGDGGPATQAALSYPVGVAVDGKGDLFIADQGNQRVREVRPDGTITTVAGNGFMDRRGSGGFFQGDGGFSGDGGPATLAALNFPRGVAVDAKGNLFIADYGNNRVREVVLTVPRVVLLGDVNGDGRVTVADAVLALRSVLGLASLTQEQRARADVDGDGAFTLGDVTLILQTAVGLRPAMGQ